jgi:hypothetical protein
MAPIDINNQEISSITLNGNTDINTVEVNGQEVFSSGPQIISVDDFEDNNLNNWSRTGGFGTSSGAAYESNFGLTTGSDPFGNGIESLNEGLPTYPQPGDTYSWYFNHRGNVFVNHCWACDGPLGSYSAGTEGGENGYALRTNDGSDNVYLFKFAGNNRTTLDGPTGSSINRGTWYKATLDWGLNGNMTVVIEEADTGNQIATVSGQDTAFNNVQGIAFTTDAGTYNTERVDFDTLVVERPT